MKSSVPDDMSSELPATGRIRTLVIGYGNELRRDDGAGPAVAHIIGKYGIPGVVAEAYHQLLPEHAAKIAAADLVIFVDAALGDADEISVRRTHPSGHPQICGHACDPGNLLALCDRIASWVPVAWFIHIPGTDFGIGEGLSPMATRHMQAAVSSILQIIKDQRK
jgi:hydrogenase maturation protease